jgi:3-hydroxyisobutyrate dehydrogenase
MAGKPVGFVGLGNMGLPMVRCLAKAGHEVAAFDVRPDAGAALADLSPRVRIASSLADVGRESDVVVTMLPNSAVVRAVVLGEAGRDGCASRLASGAIVVDMSSSFPLDTRKLAEALSERGIGVVDAPVSGGVAKAVSGTLAIMAGGEARHVDRVEGMLRAMGSVHRTGGLGSGHAMKALNNYVSAAGLLATAEALVIGRRFGLDPHVMTRVLNASTGRNNTTENKVERYMLSGSFDSGFALALMEKDVGMAQALAEELGISAEQLSLVSDLLQEAAKLLGPGADHTAVYKFIEDVAAPEGESGTTSLD